MIPDRSAHAGWAGAIVVDAGDAFSALAAMPSERREGTEATADFLVEQYNASGVAAMAMGDRDLVLGRDALVRLAARARFPFLAANLRDLASGQPVFAEHAIVERAGLRVGLLGLLSPSGAAGTVQPVTADHAPATWEVRDPVAAARAAVAALVAERVDLIVALSHLSPEEEAAVANAVPEIRVFLGGQTMAAPMGAAVVGEALSVLGGMKGRQVGVLTLELGAGRSSNARLRDADQARSAGDRAARAKTRIEALEQRLERARQAEAEAGAPLAAAPSAGVGAEPAGRRRRVTQPVAVWEQQLAAARAELQAVEAELASGQAAATGEANAVRYELVNLGSEIADDPTVKAAVEAFRARWPDPTKRPLSPEPPASGMAPGAHGPGATPTPPVVVRPRRLPRPSAAPGPAPAP